MRDRDGLQVILIGVLVATSRESGKGSRSFLELCCTGWATPENHGIAGSASLTSFITARGTIRIGGVVKLGEELAKLR